MENWWKPSEYSIEELQLAIESKQITIPPYQRGCVWNSKQKQNLIDTIKKGYPFGSILVYEDANRKQQIIDGLQRCSTIFEFVTNPTRFFDEQNIDETIIYKIVELAELGNSKEIKAQIADKITHQLIEWVKLHETMKDVRGMQYYEFALIVCNDLGTLSNKVKEVANLIKPILEEYVDVCDFILKTKIPVITLYGSEKNMPEIFERINNNGAKLTKYQIYKAAWSMVNIKIIDKRLEPLLDYVCACYDVMVDGNFEIEDYDSTQIHKYKTLNLFDLCFGFGKLLCEQFPQLFGRNEKKTKVESVGFALINACMGYRISEMDQLHTNIKACFADDKDINLFLCKILDTVNEIDKALRAVTTFKGNRRNESFSGVNHTEMQIVSFIAFAFTQKYVSFTKDNLGEKIISRCFCFEKTSNIWNERRKTFMDNCIKSYVIDCLQERWRGSGDKKLNNIVFNGIYYYKTITWDDFEKVLDLWFKGILSDRREDKRVATPKEAEKVILNIVHANTFRAEDILSGKDFDIEHLVPKAKIKKILEKINRGKRDTEHLKLPISSVGNLCYLPEESNRAKGAKTVYEDTDYMRKRKISDVEERYTFTTKESLEWLLNDEIDADTLEKEYINFVNARWTIMKEKIKYSLFC